MLDERVLVDKDLAAYTAGGWRDRFGVARGAGRVGVVGVLVEELLRVEQGTALAAGV